MKKFIFFIFVVLFFVGFVCGEIEFDENGRWACSFKAEDFPEDIHQQDFTHYGFGPTPLQGVYFYYPTVVKSGCGGESAIRAADNHAGGEGGRAFRQGIGDGTNNQDSQLQIILPQNKEIWVRFYVKWDEGWRWEFLNYQKLLSFFSVTKGFYRVCGMSWENRIDLTSKTDPNNNEWVKGDGGGWGFMQGTDKAPGEHVAYSDGSWHSVEIYARVNSDYGVYDGKASIWVDGELFAKEETVLWDEGNEGDLDGFGRLSFGVNQGRPGNAMGPLNRSCGYVYTDDIIIYNQTPPNHDSHGNPFIGPIGWNDSGSYFNCGDSICNISAGENCSNCPEDCLNTGEVCCLGIAYTGECCSDSDCDSGYECVNYNCQEIPEYHPADLNQDGIVDFSEINSYLNRWLNGEIGINELLLGINEWGD